MTRISPETMTRQTALRLTLAVACLAAAGFAAGCGGAVVNVGELDGGPTDDSGTSSTGGGSGSSSSSGSSGSSGSSTSACNPVHVAVGSNLSGTTCGWPSTSHSICHNPGYADAYVVVDAPSGATLSVTASPGVSILSQYNCLIGIGDTAACADPDLTRNTTLQTSDPGQRVFVLERVDETCGDFTFTATSP